MLWLLLSHMNVHPNALQKFLHVVRYCVCLVKNCSIPYSAYISLVFNFVNFMNLESFVNFIQQKFEPLHCNTHGQHEFAKFIQRIPSKQLFAKI